MTGMTVAAFFCAFWWSGDTFFHNLPDSTEVAVEIDGDEVVDHLLSSDGMDELINRWWARLFEDVDNSELDSELIDVSIHGELESLDIESIQYLVLRDELDAPTYSISVSLGNTADAVLLEKIVAAVLQQLNAKSILESTIVQRESNRVLVVCSSDELSAAFVNRQFANHQRVGVRSSRDIEILGAMLGQKFFVSPGIRWYVAFGLSSSRTMMGRELALSDFGPIGGWFSVESDGSIKSDSFLLLRQPRRGIASLLTFEPIDLRIEDWVPSETDVYLSVQVDTDAFCEAYEIAKEEWENVSFRYSPIEDLSGLYGVHPTNSIRENWSGRITYVEQLVRPFVWNSSGAVAAVEIVDRSRAHKAFEHMERVLTSSRMNYELTDIDSAKIIASHEDWGPGTMRFLHYVQRHDIKEPFRSPTRHFFLSGKYLSTGIDLQATTKLVQSNRGQEEQLNVQANEHLDNLLQETRDDSSPIGFSVVQPHELIECFAELVSQGHYDHVLRRVGFEPELTLEEIEDGIEERVSDRVLVARSINRIADSATPFVSMLLDESRGLRVSGSTIQLRETAEMRD